MLSGLCRNCVLNGIHPLQGENQGLGVEPRGAGGKYRTTSVISGISRKKNAAATKNTACKPNIKATTPLTSGAIIQPKALAVTAQPKMKPRDSAGVVLANQI